MTEHEWLTSSDWARMEGFARERATLRRARLCMAAFCRASGAELLDPRMHRVLAAVERCADEPDAEGVLGAIQSRWLLSPDPPPESGRWSWLGQAIADAHRLLEENRTEAAWDSGRGRARTSAAALTHAVYLSVRKAPLDVFTGGDGDAVCCCGGAISRAGVLQLREKPGLSLSEIDRATERLQETLSDLVRCVFSNPFRPVTPDPSWLTSTVVGLANAIYDARTFHDLPILADALLDAGCDDEAVLAHCRGEGPHVRGCWLIDMLTGRA